ncbi:MAG: carboxy terminal-processing peptidase [Planctomycetaceae bacterium]|nr:carboxy terminal-processing peptidase [Planctomycetaceae bacterium]
MTVPTVLDRGARGSRVSIVPWLRLNCIGAILVIAAGLQADDSPPAADSAESKAERTRLVQRSVEILERNHIRQARFDNAIAERMLEHFLKNLQDSHFVLLQDDVDALRGQTQKIHDAVLAGDLTWAHDFYKTYVQRFGAYVEVADNLLAQEMDLTRAAVLEVRDRETPYFANVEEQQAYMPLLLQELVLNRMLARKYDQAEARAGLRAHLRVTLRVAQIRSADEIEALALSSLATAYCPHSDFLSRSRLDDFAIVMRGELAGIGLSNRLADGVLAVAAVVKNGPAHKSGRIAVGDHILAVAQGVSGDWTEVEGLTMREGVDLMRGPPGSTVRLRIRKPERSRPEEVLLVRDIVDTSPDAVRSYLVTETAADGSKSKVGYIAMPQFYSRRLLSEIKGASNQRECHQDVADELGSLKSRGAEVVVLDFSGNSGGGLQNAVEVAGLFLDRRPVLQLKVGDQIESRVPTQTRQAWNGPLVVVLDRRSAGSPEIVAAALQDYGRAVIVGGRASHGMGTAASFFDPLASDSTQNPQYRRGGLRATNQGFYRPTGQTTQFVGVSADVWIPSIYDEMRIGEDALDNALELTKISPLTFRRYHFVTDDLIRSLQRSAEERRDTSTEFAAYRTDIRDYHDLTGREQRPIDEQSHRDDVNHMKELLARLTASGEPGRLNRNAFTNEAIAIAADYAAYVREHADHFNGPKFLREGKYQEAIEAFNRLLAADPANSDALRHRAQAHAFLGRWDDALSDAKAAGETFLPCYTAAASSLKVKGSDEVELPAQQRCQVTHVNEEWIYVVSQNQPTIKGWTRPDTIRPLLDGQ